MDGERKFVVSIVAIAIICLTILYGVLFIALWQYRQFVGLSLLGVIVAMAIVFMRGKWNEQNLRQARYRFNEEIPLDEGGEVHYRPQWAQENPHHVPSSGSYRTSSRRSAIPHNDYPQWSEGYPQQQSRY
jgi:hypothetical protein